MNYILKLSSIALLILSLFIPSLSIAGDDKHETVLVNRIIDGDTFVGNDQKIRIWGIDAPEKDEAKYLASKLFLETLIDQAELQCTFIEFDFFTRKVMRCVLDGSDIASLAVQMGMARDYTKYSKGYYRLEEENARKNEYGIWSDGNN